MGFKIKYSLSFTLTFTGLYNVLNMYVFDKHIKPMNNAYMYIFMNNINTLVIHIVTHAYLIVQIQD